MSKLGIVELGDVCAVMRARSLDLFELLGGWVTTTAPGDEQRLYAEACHRHARHAELWAQRAPRIPPVDLDALTERSRGTAGNVSSHERAGTYRRAVDELLDDLGLLAARVDPMLDPSTARTSGLVVGDLVELRRRLHRAAPQLG